VLHALRDRLPQQNAVELGAQLPMVIRGMYYEGWDLQKEPSRGRHDPHSGRGPGTGAPAQTGPVFPLVPGDLPGGHAGFAG
jgi:Uncharacterized conserved protein (DUF2267)